MADAYECDGCGAVESGEPQVRLGTDDCDGFAGDVLYSESTNALGLPMDTNPVTFRGGELCSECTRRMADAWHNLDERAGLNE